MRDGERREKRERDEQETEGKSREAQYSSLNCTVLYLPPYICKYRSYNIQRDLFHTGIEIVKPLEQLAA